MAETATAMMKIQDCVYVLQIDFQRTRETDEGWQNSLLPADMVSEVEVPKMWREKQSRLPWGVTWHAEGKATCDQRHSQHVATAGQPELQQQGGWLQVVASLGDRDKVFKAPGLNQVLLQINPVLIH